MRSVTRTDIAEPLIARWRASWRVVMAIAACGVSSASAAEPLATRLRVSLEASEAVAWRGEFSVEGGELEKLQPLSLEPAAAAGSSLQHGRVRLHHRRPTRRDLFDITVRRPPGAKLTLKLRDQAGEPIGRVTIDLDGAMDAPQSATVGDSGAAIGVTRLEVDRLRVETDRRSLLFAPEEPFSFDVLADPRGVSQGETYDFVATLARGRTGEVVWQSESVRRETPADGPARLPITIPLPAEEGVYRVTLRATRPSGFLARFPTGGPPPPLAERTFQVAVLDPDQRPPKPGNWEPTYAFDPRTHSWADRVPEWMRWRRLPWFAKGPLSSEAEDPPISPTTAEGEAHWRAYPLPIAEPGSTYAIEIETIGEPGDQLTIAVMEPDALGDLRPVSGCVTHTVSRWNRAGKRSPARLIVRPRTASPLLVLTNPNAERPARFGKIRLLKSRGIDASDTPMPERLVALDWTDADLPHTLGASHVKSIIGRFEQADLLTYWQTARALADRVEFAGGNAAMIPVNARGAAIYPSRNWASPALDLGTWQEGSADLPRRELLATIFREFERRGLKLIPTLRFEAPTPSVESSERPTAYQADTDEVTTTRSLIVEEVLNVVAGSPAIAGIAVRASDGDWALLAPSGSATQVRTLASSYEQLGSLVERRLGEAAKLYILPSEVFRSEELQRALQPRLGETNSTAEPLIAASGLMALANPAHRVQVAAPFGTLRPDLSTFASYRSLTSVDETTIALRGRSQPIRLIDSAQRLREAGNESAGDVRLLAAVADAAAETSVLSAAETASTIVLSGPRAAGWVDPSAAEQLTLLAALPVPETSNLSGSAAAAATTGDMTTRAIDTRSGNSLAVVTNRSAWDRLAHVTIELPQRMRGGMSLAGGPPAVEQWFDAGQHVVDLELRAYETAAWQFDRPGVVISGVRVEPALDARRELAEAIGDLQSRDTTQRRTYEQVANPSFERDEETSDVSGWLLGPGVRAIDDSAIDGEACLALQSSQQRSAVVTSEPFPLPATGQLVLGLQVGAIGPSSQASLQIELEEANGPYRKSALLQASQLTADPDTDQPWLPVMFPVDDLPLDADGQLMLRFTLSGSGEVRIDALRLEDLILPLDGYEAIDLRSERFAVVRLLTAAENALRDGRLEACREHIESYWARFIVENFPRRDEAPALAESEEPIEEDEAEVEATPSISERLRGYLPRWLR